MLHPSNQDTQFIPHPPTPSRRWLFAPCLQQTRPYPNPCVALHTSASVWVYHRNTLTRTDTCGYLMDTSWILRPLSDETLAWPCAHQTHSLQMRGFSFCEHHKDRSVYNIYKTLSKQQCKHCATQLFVFSFKPRLLKHKHLCFK